MLRDFIIGLLSITLYEIANWICDKIDKGIKYEEQVRKPEETRG